MPPPNSVIVAAAVRPPPPALSPLYKHKSWSPDILRDEEWLKRKDKHHHRHRRRNKSVTDEDIDELKACIELGFGFDESNHRLSNTFPALGFYYAVHKQYHDSISKSSSISSSSSSVSVSVSESDLVPSPEISHAAVFTTGDDPETKKTRLRQWAQVVACSLRQSSSSLSSSLSSSSSSSSSS